MKRVHLLFLAGALLLGALAATGCHSDGFDRSEFESANVCLKVRGNVVFNYVKESSQLSLNRGRKEFRAGTDTMSDYFVIKMSDLPREDGQVLTASLTWTTDDNIVSRTGLSFKVERIDPDGTVWLWCASQKIVAVIRLLQ